MAGSPGEEKNGNGEGDGLRTSEQEVEWLQVSVNATTDARKIKVTGITPAIRYSPCSFTPNHCSPLSRPSASYINIAHVITVAITLAKTPAVVTRFQ